MNYPEPLEIFLHSKEEAPLLSTELFLKLEACDKKIIVLQGGGDAAKTSATLTWLTVKAIQTPKTKVNVVGPTIPHLKDGALQLFQNYIEDNAQVKPYIRSFNKTDRDYNINDSRFVFKAYETSKKARGSENDYVFMNEANLMDYDLFWELQRKCRKKIIIDYNPTFAFWVHSKLLNKESPTFEKQFENDVQLFIVDHRHNPFLSEKDHDSYENISDPERFKVYARGLTGQTKGQILRFKKVDEIPVLNTIQPDGSVVESSLPFGFGMDIGYTTDKTTIVKVYMNGKDHYYQELLYMSNDEIQNKINADSILDEQGNIQTVEGFIAEILYRNGLQMDTMLWGDHDKAMSAKLRRLNVPYRMAKKGPNSEAASISSVKRYNGFMYQSPNIEKEIGVYIWQTAVDILTGNEVTTGVPIAGVPDHCFVAETMVTTIDGLKKIIDINVGDSVLTSEGFKGVLIKWNNGVQQVNKYLLQLDTLTISLTCTPDHLIKTNVGWIKISQLESGMTINLSSHLMGKDSNFTKEKNILITGLKKCISTYGNILTGKLKKGNISTIKMVTSGIIKLIILNVKQGVLTWPIMVRKGLQKIRNGLKNSGKNRLLPPMPGNKLQKAGRAIGSGQLNSSLANGIYQKRNVKIAPKYLSQLIPLQNSAPMTVNLQIEESQELTMKKEHVIFAEKSLQQINIQELKAVVRNVEFHSIGLREVYDLTVDEVHEYYANGILVHNCIAAIRYYEHSYSLRFGG